MPPKLTDRDGLRHWADSPATTAALPSLVRRLLLETVGGLRGVDLPAGSGIWAGGFDGRVHAPTPHAFCPAGDSVWELSVSPGPAKRKSDLAKRTAEARAGGNIDPASTDYVAVTLRVVKDKQEWGRAQTAAGPWRSVRQLDADDLDTWLEQAPVTACWLAEQLGLPASGLQGIEDYLAAWSTAEGRPISPGLLLAGRDRGTAAEVVREWAAASEDVHLHVHAAHRDEALAFVAAALDLDAVDGELWRARTHVALTEDAYRSATAGPAQAPRLVLPAFDGFVSSKLPAAGRGVRVVVPVTGARLANATVALTPLPVMDMARWLDEHEAFPDGYDLASGAGGDVTSLRRLLSHEHAIDWEKSASVEVLVLLLTGAWSPAVEADRDFVGRLGADPAELERVCHRLAAVADAPVFLQSGRLGARLVALSSKPSTNA